MARVLVVSPHPDDESIGCGGTLRKHVVDGDQVRVVCLTSGERGGRGRPPAEVGPQREAEAVAACAILRAESPEFWRLPDGGLRVDAETVQRMVQTLREWVPQVVYVTHEHEQHPDHAAAAQLMRQALASMGGAPCPVVWQMEVWTPLSRMDHVVDISPYLEDKLAAIRCHASQCERMKFDEAARGLARYRGEMHSWPGGDYAEVFLRLR
jgi:LmbE family N-acetylglucosaminyl deacetylase